jgi:hypothetical protein
LKDDRNKAARNVTVVHPRRRNDEKNKHRCLQASIIEKSGHTRWIYSADLSVFNRHTSQEASVVKVKG